MNFVGPGTRLADADLPRLGALVGVGEDELHAFLDVETNGGGFDELKRPKILYEFHVFFRNLSGAKQATAAAAGLASRSQGVFPYGKSSEQYPRLLRAMAIDETAALKACSWGIGQVLGENFVAAGFDSVQAMVEAMVQDEAEQLEASIRFIKANHLDDELRAHNWPAFARGYNGANYAKFAYDTKLAAAYLKWSKIRDTPYPAPSSQTLRAAINAPGVVKVDPVKPIASVQMDAPPVPRPAPLAAPKQTWGDWFKSAFFARKDA